MAGRIKQSADAAENARIRLRAALKVLDDVIGANPFVAGARPSIADCTLLAALEFAAFAGVALDPGVQERRALVQRLQGAAERPGVEPLGVRTSA